MVIWVEGLWLPWCGSTKGYLKLIQTEDGHNRWRMERDARSAYGHSRNQRQLLVCPADTSGVRNPWKTPACTGQNVRNEDGCSRWSLSSSILDRAFVVVVRGRRYYQRSLCRRFQHGWYRKWRRCRELRHMSRLSRTAFSRKLVLKLIENCELVIWEIYTGNILSRLRSRKTNLCHWLIPKKLYRLENKTEGFETSKTGQETLKYNRILYFNKFQENILVKWKLSYHEKGTPANFEQRNHKTLTLT